ncbi:DNA cytosine methyltransferase [Streptomyces sp. NBC_01207]|uniref:DNA cytosine methyltransferase n=1 Tax=Streptomyces sp. NBC_01207 TaxID=2903772 RepID=UPI002E140C22|nr:DNA cytosine methyltransferase [Streptomyces sp. NBC_01207]
MPDKPPYRVPSMEEIRALPWNGFTAASSFSGCGGSSLGYRLAGFRVGWASEFIPAAQDTYRANAAPHTVLDTRDIREVTGAEILAALGLAVGELDLWDGSPPCASFSTTGKGAAGWGETRKYSDAEQRTDDLFFEYARLIEELQPRTFVAENVSGLIKGAAKGYFKLILARLKAAGYRVEARLLDAARLGVPQARQRLIFVGVRDDLDASPVFPAPLPYAYTVTDAVAGLAAPAGLTHDPDTGYRLTFAGLTSHDEWLLLRPGQCSRKYLNLVRSHPHKPANTLIATFAPGRGPTHWSEPRLFTLAELRRFSGFPDDFTLTGTHAQRSERIGRAVPPVMMAHIAGAVRDHVLTPLRESGRI